MAVRKHRVPSHPSPEPAHSELQPRALSRGRPHIPERQTHHFVLEPEVPALSTLGRGGEETRELWTCAPAATRGEASRRPLSTSLTSAPCPASGWPPG